MLLLLRFGCAQRPVDPVAVAVRVRTQPGVGGDIVRLELEASLDGQRQFLTATADGQSVAFPIALSFPFRRADGTLEVSVRAFDANAAQVDQGTASLAVLKTDPAPMLEVTLDRRSPARISVDPHWQLVGPTAVGETAARVEVKVKNLGGTALARLNLTVSGDVNDFAVEGECVDLPLGASGDCVLFVTFRPTLDGRRSITASVGGQSFAVEGDGALLHKVTFAVSGDGVVEFSNRSCPKECDAVVPHGQLVTFQATAAAHSAFAGWSLPECPGLLPTCVVAVDRALDVTARFEAFDFLLKVESTAGGWAYLDFGSGKPLLCIDCEVWVPRDQPVTVIPTTQNALGFSHFSGDCQGEAQSGCSFRLTRTANIQLVWEELNFAFVTYGPIVGGIASLAQADARCQAVGPFRQTRHYRAWLSTSAVPAASRFNGARGFQTADERILADSPESMLAGQSRRALEMAIDSTGQVARIDTLIATGTRADGGLGNNCNDWTSSTGTFTAGSSSLAATGFTEATEEPCSAAKRVLCLGTDFKSALAASDAEILHRRTFVTGQRFVPSNGIAAANALCAAEATAASLDGNFVASLGTTTQKTPMLTLPFLNLDRLDGEMAWVGYESEVALNMTADRSFLGVEPVWLGTAANPNSIGGPFDTCADWTSGTTGRVTLAPKQGPGFLTETTLQPCASGAHLFCVESP